MIALDSVLQMLSDLLSESQKQKISEDDPTERDDGVRDVTCYINMIHRSMDRFDLFELIRCNTVCPVDGGLNLYLQTTYAST